MDPTIPGWDGFLAEGTISPMASKANAGPEETVGQRLLRLRKAVIKILDGLLARRKLAGGTR